MIWNPYNYGPSGNHLGLVAPAQLKVMTDVASLEQMQMAQVAFARFSALARVSAGANPQHFGKLADGTPYRIATVGAQTTMWIWPGESDVPDYADCGILVVPTDNTERRYLLKPGGKAGRSVRPWKVERKDWLLHSSNAVGIVNTPQYAKLTWHAARGPEYLVALDNPEQAQERMGTAVLKLNRAGVGTGGVPWVAHALEGTPRRWITDERPFGGAVANALLFPISETNPTLPGTYPVVRTDPDVIPIRESVRVPPLYEDVDNVFLRQDGLRALVAVRGYTDDGSGAVPPNTWYPVRQNIRRVGAIVGTHTAVAIVEVVLAGDPNASQVVEEHEFSGSSWSKVGNQVEGRIGSCSPAFAEYLQGPTAETERIRNYLNWTMARPTVYARPPASCDYNPGPGGPPNSIGEVLNNSVHGPMNYREWMTAQHNDGLARPGEISAWYAVDGTICPMRAWSRSSINNDVRGTVNRDFYAEWECFETDTTGIAGMTRWNQVDSVDVTIEDLDETGWFIGSREFVTASRSYKERRSSTVQNVADLITDGGIVTANGTGSLTVDVACTLRNLLVVDHQLDLIVYTETKFDYQVQQGASYFFNGSYYDWTSNPASEIGTSTGRTGILPDWVIPPCDIVIECRGQVLRIPTTFDPDPDAQLNNRRLMRPNSAMGSYFEKDVVEGGMDRAILARDWSFSLAYSAKGMIDSLLLHNPDPAEPRTSMHLGNTSYGVVPGLSANPGNVSAEYAKDPKTGGAVLVLRAQDAVRAPGFPVGYAIDSEGLRPLGTVLAIGADEFNTFGSA